jgi:hypothetical protein
VADWATISSLATAGGTLVLAAAATERRAFTSEVLYTDQVGGQRTISRFGVLPEDDGGWIGAVARHWYLDAAAPR